MSARSHFLPCRDPDKMRGPGNSPALSRDQAVTQPSPSRCTWGGQNVHTPGGGRTRGAWKKWLNVCFRRRERNVIVINTLKFSACQFTSVFCLMGILKTLKTVSICIICKVSIINRIQFNSRNSPAPCHRIWDLRTVWLQDSIRGDTAPAVPSD